MLSLAVTMMRNRIRATLGACAAIAVAVVLVTSCGMLLESSMRAEIPVERLDNAAVVVQAEPTLRSSSEAGLEVMLSEKTRLDAGLASSLRSTPGVDRVVADRSFPVQVSDRVGNVVADVGSITGHGWSSAILTPYQISGGRAPQSTSEVVLTSQLADALSVRVGGRVQATSSSSNATYVVTGLVTGPEAAASNQLFFTDDVAAGLNGTGDRADLLGIVIDEGVSASAVAERVREALPDDGLRVLTGSSRGEAESPGDAVSKEDTIAGLTIFGVLAAFVAVFVVSSAFAMSVQQRHRELALLRAIGATPRQVRRVIAGEALALAVVTTIVAAPVAIAFAVAERWLFVRADLLSSSVSLSIGWLPYVGGLLVAIVKTQLAAFSSARRASRIHPTEAMRESAIEPRRLGWARCVAGLAFIGAGGWLFMNAVRTIDSGGADTAPIVAMAWTIAAALLGPLIARPFTAVLAAPLRWWGKAPGLLARASTRSGLRRVASVATPLMLTVALGSTIVISKSTMQQHTVDDSRARTTADLVIGSESGAGLTQNVAAAAEETDGVGNASATLSTTVVASDGENLHSMPAQAVDARTIGAVMNLGVTAGSLDRLNGSTIAVRNDSAPHLGHVGDRVDLSLGDGTPVRVTIVAAYDRGLGFGDVLVPRSLVAGHTTQSFDEKVFVGLDAGNDADAVAAKLQNAVSGSGATVSTRSEYVDDIADAASRKAREIYLLLGIIVIFCGIAIVNALSMAIGERTREFALLRLVGASRRQIARMVRAETVLIVCFGTVVGALVSAPAVAALSYSLTGSPVPSAPPALWIGSAMALVLLGLVAGAPPTRRALRNDPLAAIGAER